MRVESPCRAFALPGRCNAPDFRDRVDRGDAVTAAREVEVAFVIADLSGYSALTEAHGDSHAAGVVARYEAIAAGILPPGVRVVERVGDELLLAAGTAADAVRAAVDLRAAVEREPLFPAVRVGIHRGHALEQGGHYVGASLNLTARVAAHARAGQILCTEPVASAAGAVGGAEYRPLGPARFKNIVGPVMLFEVVAAPLLAATTAIDPVCRMQVDPETAPARLPFGGRTYWFCSFECARRFAERPQEYTAGEA